MRQNFATQIGVAIFTAVIPAMVGAMSPHIDLVTGVLAISVSTLIAVGILAWGHSSHSRLNWREKLLPLAMMGLGIAIYAAGALWYYSRHAKTAEIPEEKKIASGNPPNISSTTNEPPKIKNSVTLEQIYNNDFNFVSEVREFRGDIKDKITGSMESINITLRMYIDFGSHIKFVSIYIPFTNKNDISSNLPNFINGLIPSIDEVVNNNDILFGMSRPGIPYQNSTEIVFSGRVFLYTMN